MKTFARIACAALAVGAALAAATDPAEAARKQYQDKRRGFRMKVEDSLVASPPKLTTDEAHVVAEWYEDRAKYDRAFAPPTFQVVWFVTPKDGPPGTVAEPEAPPPPPPPGPATPPTEPPANPPAPPAPEDPGPKEPAPPAVPADPAPAPEAPTETPPVPTPPDPAGPSPEAPPQTPPDAPPAPPPSGPAPPDAPASGAPPPDAPPPEGPAPGGPAPEDPAPPPADAPKPPNPDPPAPPPDAPPAPPEPKPAAEEPEAPRGPTRPKSVDDVCGRLFGIAQYFGPVQPMAERWKAAEKGKTADGTPFEWIEVNPELSKKKKKAGEREAPVYGFAARLTLDRPLERIEVGFVGYCSREFREDYADEFVSMVRSFHELKNATDSRNEAAQRELSKDKTERFRQILETKVIKGWAAEQTENYILLYSKEVEPALVRDIGKQIEAIRAQVYEVLFPPDKEIYDVSIVRVCKDKDQYVAYGGHPQSAGYWNSHAEELVFFEDQSNKGNSLSVLYHEAFHQYIYYSVGDFAPHSWFNEGHGDFFAGHNYAKASGKFKCDVFDWRVTTAKEWKRNPKRPPLREWVQWTQMQYYGTNKADVPIGANYALGWSLVYFLRTTKKPEYQGVLERYFKSLKGSVTRARDAREEFLKKLKAAADAGLPRPERGATSDVANPVIWLRDAVTEAFRGIDWDKIEKDWLAAEY